MEHTVVVRINAISVVVCCLSAVAPSLAQEVRVSGTSVTMAPPPGFSPAQRFPGFERPDVQASIMVTELPTSAAQMKRGMTKEALATRGMTLISSRVENVGGEQALMLNVSQSAGGEDFLKWMLITGGPKATIMIVGTWPRSGAAEVGEAIRASLLTARTGGVAAPDPFEGLQFRVTPSATLQLAGRMSNMLILNESGKMGSQGPGSAMFAVGNSISATKIDDLRTFSETRAKQTAKTSNLRIRNAESLTIDGLDAYEVVAEGTDTTGRQVTLYQVIVPDAGGYFIMQGLISSDRAAAMVPEFRSVAYTFRRVTGR